MLATRLLGGWIERKFAAHFKPGSGRIRIAGCEDGLCSRKISRELNVPGRHQECDWINAIDFGQTFEVSKVHGSCSSLPSMDSGLVDGKSVRDLFL